MKQKERKMTNEVYVIICGLYAGRDKGCGAVICSSFARETQGINSKYHYFTFQNQLQNIKEVYLF